MQSCNLKTELKKKKKNLKMYKFYWNIYTLITKPQQQGFYWNIDFDTSVCFMILAPKYIILAKIVGKRCMFQDSREKGREKVYVSRSNAVMISSGAIVVALPLPSLPIQKKRVNCSIGSQKTLFQKTHEGTL